MSYENYESIQDLLMRIGKLEKQVKELERTIRFLEDEKKQFEFRKMLNTSEVAEPW